MKNRIQLLTILLSLAAIVISLVSIHQSRQARAENLEIALKQCNAIKSADLKADCIRWLK